MNQIEKYFNAEKYESVLFVLVGMVAIATATYFFVRVKQSFYYGMAYPLIAVALIQIVVGGSVYFRSPKDIARVTEIVQTNKVKIQTEEIPRMKTVMKNFAIYRWVEILLLLTGIIMFFYFQPLNIWKGVGAGLAIQAGFMLLLDFFAESRGRIYLEYLMKII
jgi:multidrug transporter EmrE-like cation transporter